MQVEFFGVLKEVVGSNQVTLDMSPPVAIAEILDRLTSDYPALKSHLPRVACAVGDEVKSRQDLLQADEVLVLLPPVSGG
ncbi:MoaD/ThiS family protein [Spiribacter sp. C176]|uniref:MoaD/ThiS family protein n=1 Tax=Spiribacter salilacus TaxID=2664894 RepID=A0A6N7QRB4_9GAMM|nr:MoaD/ThiS family protein [Spiribacter salilacus]MRH77973.1 MoaD/ThiS family protein [Spiribacter salilacus]